MVRIKNWEDYLDDKVDDYIPPKDYKWRDTDKMDYLDRETKKSIEKARRRKRKADRIIDDDMDL